MGIDQKGPIVFRISRSENNRWDVSENDFEKTLGIIRRQAGCLRLRKQVNGNKERCESTDRGSRLAKIAAG